MDWNILKIVIPTAATTFGATVTIIIFLIKSNGKGFDSIRDLVHSIKDEISKEISSLKEDVEKIQDDVNKVSNAQSAQNEKVLMIDRSMIKREVEYGDISIRLHRHEVETAKKLGEFEAKIENLEKSRRKGD